MVALVSHAFTVPLDEALDMELSALEEWAREAVELYKRLYQGAPPQRR